MNQFMLRLSFSASTLGYYVVDMCVTKRIGGSAEHEKQKKEA